MALNAQNEGKQDDSKCLDEYAWRWLWTPKLKKRWWLKIEEDSTQSNKTMIDRYRCGPSSNWTRKVIGTWPIDIGAAPKTRIDTKNWPIDTGAVPTQKFKLKLTWQMTDRYRCGPRNTNWYDKEMADRYRCGLIHAQLVSQLIRVQLVLLDRGSNQQNL